MAFRFPNGGRPTRGGEGLAVGGSSSLSMVHNSNGSGRKTAFALELNVARMVQEAGVERIGFLTLTVGDSVRGKFRQVFDSGEASRRINSLCTGLIRDLFQRAVIVTERHKSQAIHFHLVVQTAEDIRTGFDFVSFFRREGYAGSALPALRSLWGILRKRLPLYGFGRSELTPLYSTGEAVSRYVSKYVEKHLAERLPQDRGKKLVRYLGWKGGQMKPNDFCWATPGACEWRKNVQWIAALHGIKERCEARGAWGSRWAHRLTRVIIALESAPEMHPRVASDFVRQWSEREMVDPTWWRTAEDVFREAEISACPTDSGSVCLADIAEAWEQLRFA